MNRDEYMKLEMGLPTRITVEDLTNRNPRTLVYGYTCDRNTWHLYLDDAGQFRRVLYDYDGFLIEAEVYDNIAPSDCLPNKRVYAQKSDFEFCQLLQNCGESLSFTTFEEAHPLQWYGKRHEELVQVAPDAFEVTIPVTWEDLQFPTDKFPYVRLDGHQKERLRESVERVLEGQTEGYLRSCFLGQPKENWLTNIATSAQFALSKQLEQLNLVECLPYEVPDAVRTDLVNRAKSACAAKLSPH